MRRDGDRGEGATGDQCDLAGVPAFCPAVPVPVSRRPFTAPRRSGRNRTVDTRRPPGDRNETRPSRRATRRACQFDRVFPFRETREGRRNEIIRDVESNV